MRRRAVYVRARASVRSSPTAEPVRREKSNRHCGGYGKKFLRASTLEQAAVISGANGSEPATSAELSVLTEIGLPVRNPGTHIGHGIDAHFVACLGITCAAIEHGKLFAPAGRGDRGDSPAALRQAAVTSVGTWRGEGMTLIERVD